MAKKKFNDRSWRIKSNPKHGEIVLNNIPPSEALRKAESGEDDLLEGLTDTQQYIFRLRLRGLTLAMIAKTTNTSVPNVSQHLKKIRAHLQQKGKNIDTYYTTGETLSVYEEIERKAWELYYTGDNADKAKALSLLMNAREKNTKFLLDLGKLERASSKTEVQVNLPSFVEKFKKANVSELAQDTISAHLTALPEPVPPDEDDDITDAEIEGE